MVVKSHSFDRRFANELSAKNAIKGNKLLHEHKRILHIAKRGGLIAEQLVFVLERIRYLEHQPISLNH